MKKLIGSALMLLLLGAFSSCGNDLNPEEEGNYRHQRVKEKPVMKTIRMQFGGDYVSELDEPLQRAEDGEMYVGVNVFRTENGVENAKEGKYAYGLFKNTQSVSIDVVTGYTYRFQASLLVEREDKLWYTKSAYYDAPFNRSTGDFPKSDMNKFLYSYTEEPANQIYLVGLSSGTAWVDTGNDLSSRYGDLWYPRVKRYYGTYSGFDPAFSEDVEIEMAYKCFGLRFELESIPSGSVTVRDITKKDANRNKEPKELLVFPEGLVLSEEDNPVWEGLYSMNKLLEDSETFNLEFTWHKGGNDTEVFTKDITIRPKTRKILKLSITGTPNYGTKGNITFNLDTEDLQNEEIPVEGNFN